MRYSLRPLWEVATLATGKSCCVLWEPKLDGLNWLGRANTIHPVRGRWTIELNPVKLCGADGLPNDDFASVFWHESYHILQGHPMAMAPVTGLTMEPIDVWIKRAAAGSLRTTHDADNPVGNRYERDANLFASMAAERWPTSWLLRQMLVP